MSALGANMFFMMLVAAEDGDYNQQPTAAHHEQHCALCLSSTLLHYLQHPKVVIYTFHY